MPKSIKQLQDELLRSGMLNKIGTAEYERLNTLPALEQLLILSAANFIIKVKENIETLGLSNTGHLSDDLSQGDLTKQGGTYSISMGYPKNSKAAKYYDFVNKGVKGVKDKSVNSPYSFKNLYVGKKMLSNIHSWVKSTAIRPNDVAITKGQQKRKSLSKMASEASKKKSLAFAIAYNIKRRGLKKTGFFDKAVESYFGNDFTQAVSKIVGNDLRIIIQSNGNYNK